MYGPTLVELQQIAGASIDQISTVFTWLGAGGIAGSLTYGFLYDRFETAPIIITTLAFLGVTTSLIPIFHHITIMMALCAAQAFLFNGISIGMLFMHSSPVTTHWAVLQSQVYFQVVFDLRSIQIPAIVL